MCVDMCHYLSIQEVKIWYACMVDIAMIYDPNHTIRGQGRRAGKWLGVGCAKTCTRDSDENPNPHSDFRDGGPSLT